MKPYKVPTLLFAVFIATFFLKGFIYNEIIWRIIDIVNYNLLPISIIALFFKLRQTKESFNFIILTLTVYFLMILGVHWDFMKSIATETLESRRLESLLILNSINSFVFYVWSISLLVFLTTLIVLIIKNKIIESENYLKNRLFIITISLVFVLYFLDYGFFDPHPGWTGWHGHSFWETSGHLH
ncbi:hypothetical protein [Roseivirga pacifica]